MASLPALQARIGEITESKGFRDVGRSFGDIVALVHSELSEALEEHRDGRAPDDIYFREDGKPEGVAVEMADAVIRILDWFDEVGLDAEKVIQMKVDFNEGRPFMHGKTL